MDKVWDDSAQVDGTEEQFEQVQSLGYELVFSKLKGTLRTFIDCESVPEL